MEETPVPGGEGVNYGSLLPMGGTRENGSHKGYGFLMIVDILCAFMSGSVPAVFDEEYFESGYKHYFAAYNIASFTDVDSFKDNMDQMLRTLRETPPEPGSERVLYPGLAEHEEEAGQARQRHPPAHRSHRLVRRNLQRTRHPPPADLLGCSDVSEC